MDLNDSSSTRLVKDSPVDRLADTTGQDGDSREEKVHPLDTEAARQLHEQLVSMYRQELDRQSENRFQMAVDEDYFDNIQWAEEDAAVLRDRGQAPLVYNVISTSVRWVLGSEKRARMDFKVLPRRKEEGKAAEKKTSLLKYLSDVNRTQFHRSRAFKDAVVTGIGWLEVGVQDEDDSEPIYDRYESWRNVLWDSAGTEMDLSDSRYLFRSRWIDVDVAKTFFPGREAAIDSAAVEGEQFGSFDGTDGDEAMDYAEYHREDYGIARNLISHKRKRVRLIECWFKKPVRKKRIMQGPWRGQAFDSNDPRHQEFAESIAEKPMFAMHVAVMTNADFLYLGASPYRHNRFPLIPIWGHKRGRDGLPYGMVRGLRDIQDDINKRAAKAQYLMSVNKVILDKGAVDDIDEFREEWSRPDAVVEKNSGKTITPQDQENRRDAQMQLEMFSRGITMIQQVGGVTDELLARKSNATSGVAIERRQEQGSLVSMDFFDNLRFAEQQRGEIELSLIEQFMTGEKQFRITNARGNADFVAINTGLPEDDITRTKADFVVSEQDWHASVRQANTEQLVEMVAKLAPVAPQVALVTLDLIVETMEITNRDELVKRIRHATGMRDPDATEPTPEELAAQKAAAEKAAFEQQVAQANLRKLNADAAVKEATAERMQTQTIGDRVNAQNTAVLAAREVVASAGIAPVADNLLAEAGWPGAQPVQPPAAVPAQPVPPPAAAGIDQPQPL